MPAKSSKPPIPPLPPPSSLSTHLATVQLKQRILDSLSKLSDRDTHQIAVADLENLIKTVSPDTIPIILNSLFDATSDTTINKPPIKKQAIRLLSVVCAAHTESTATHLAKIVTHIVKRLKDSDSGVKDSICESIGHLSFLYLKNDDDNNNNNNGGLVSVFVKPLFEAMSEPNKWVQSGAAMCMVRVVEMASDPPVLAFQKLCGRICKFLKSPNFLANDALLPVVSSLAQVGAISPRFWEPLLQTIHDCLSSADWSTRKAAADTLNALALHSSNLIREKPTSTITILEACRFDKIKPIRDSITEALQVWKFVAGDHEDDKTADQNQDSEPATLSRKNLSKLDDKRVLTPVQNGQTNGQNISEKSTVPKKKGPPLSDKEPNPEFFQRLSRRVSGEVEVIVNGRCINLLNEEESEVNDTNDDEKLKSKSNQPDGEVNLQDCRLERGGGRPFCRRRESDNKGNLLGIQKQLLHLEKQQARLMNMLQAFKGGSHDGMVTLENRVWGLERIVDDMARNFSVSLNTLRSSYTERPFVKYHDFSHYHTHGPNTQTGSKRAVNNRLSKRAGPIRCVEGPSARRVWAAPDMSAQMLGNENIVQNHDINTAFGEVLASGDDFSLVRLMDKTGPVIDQLSGEVANEVLCAVAQFLIEPNLFDICLSWIQQLLDMIMENGKDFLGIPVGLKNEILVNLSKALSSVDPPENWEGLMPDQVLLQLALAWDINAHHLRK